MSLLEKFQLLFLRWLFFWVWILLSMASSSIVIIFSLSFSLPLSLLCFYLTTTFSATPCYLEIKRVSLMGMGWCREGGILGVFWLFLRFSLLDLGNVGVCLEDCYEILRSFYFNTLNFSTASSNDFMPIYLKLIYLNRRIKNHSNTCMNLESRLGCIFFSCVWEILLFDR